MATAVPTTAAAVIAHKSTSLTPEPASMLAFVEPAAGAGGELDGGMRCAARAARTLRLADRSGSSAGRASLIRRRAACDRSFISGSSGEAAMLRQMTCGPLA